MKLVDCIPCLMDRSNLKMKAVKCTPPLYETGGTRTFWKRNYMVISCSTHSDTIALVRVSLPTETLITIISSNITVHDVEKEYGLTHATFT